MGLDNAINRMQALDDARARFAELKHREKSGQLNKADRATLARLRRYDHP